MCNNDVYNKLGIWVGGYVVNSLEERVDRWGLREGKGSPGEALAAHPDQRFREYIVRGIREGLEWALTTAEAAPEQLGTWPQRGPMPT